MKRNFYLGTVLILFSVFIVGPQGFAAAPLYDDFSGTYIDSQKWMQRELVREVAGGKLVSKVGNDTSTEEARNNTAFQNPSSITVIQCDITMVATTLDAGTDPKSFARIDGRFYNTLNSGTQKGDVWAAVYIGDRGSGLRAWWVINESLDDEGASWADQGHGTLPTGELSYGTPYTAKIEYDVPNQFTFTVGGVSSGAVAGPARQAAEFHAYKGLETGAFSTGGSGTGYASALFDNVYVNDEATVYDDFSTAPLDSTKWQYLELVRETSGGKLRLNVQAEGERRDALLRPSDEDVLHLQAKVLVESGSSVSDGASGIARIGGYYYNDSRGPGSGQDYNGFEGDVWVDNRIMLDESGNLKARCFLRRLDSDDESGPATYLFDQDFSTPIAFDTEYTLSIQDTGSAFIFRCNNETYQYTIKTARYDPSIGQRRQLTSRIDADDPAESGYIKANFDDVYTGCPAQPTYDANGTWTFSTHDSWANCPGDDDPDPDETGTCTITQTGDNFTLEVNGDIYTGTICGATYSFIETYPQQAPSGEAGTETVTLTVTLSSSTTGSGSHTETWLADDGSFACGSGGFFSLTKQAAPPPAEDGGGGGGGCLISTVKAK